MLSKLERPTPHRFIAHFNAASGQHFLDHAKAQGKAKIQPDRVADERRRKTIASVRNGCILVGGLRSGGLLHPLHFVSLSSRGGKLTIPYYVQNSVWNAGTGHLLGKQQPRSYENTRPLDLWLVDELRLQGYTDFYKIQYNYVMLYTLLSTAAQTAYASLASASRLDDVRTVAELPGSFSTKVIKGKEYLYYQTPDLTGKQMQIFLGSASAELTQLVALHRNSDGKKAHLRQLTRQAIAAGCPSIVPNHAKIIERLADAGFFRAGGILVGTHVYMAYQNYLGIAWRSAAQTVDLDFAHALRIKAAPEQEPPFGLWTSEAAG